MFRRSKMNIVRLSPVGAMPDVQPLLLQAQQMRDQVRVGQHGLAQLLSGCAEIDRAVKRECPAQAVERFAAIVGKGLVKPREGLERPAQVSQQQVLRAEQVALA